MQQTQSDFDKRAAYLKLTRKGIELCDRLYGSVNEYMKAFESTVGPDFGLDRCTEILKRIEHFWKDALMRRI
jgi:hypothetical protein